MQLRNSYWSNKVIAMPPFCFLYWLTKSIRTALIQQRQLHIDHKTFTSCTDYGLVHNHLHSFSFWDTATVFLSDPLAYYRWIETREMELHSVSSLKKCAATELQSLIKTRQTCKSPCMLILEKKQNTKLTRTMWDPNCVKLQPEHSCQKFNDLVKKKA